MLPATGTYKTARPVTVSSNTRKTCSWSAKVHAIVYCERRPSCNTRHLLVSDAFLFYWLIINDAIKTDGVIKADDVIKPDDVITIACLICYVTLRH